MAGIERFDNLHLKAAYLRQAIIHVFTILTPAEKRNCWWLAIADIVISLLDILFLLALVYGINFYTQPLQPARFSFLRHTGLHPALVIAVFCLLFAFRGACVCVKYRRHSTWRARSCASP